KLGPLVGCAMSPCAPKLLPCCISRLWMGLIAILTISLSIWLSFTSVDRHWHRWPSLLVSGAVADVSGCFPLWARLAHDQARLGNVSVGHHAANLLPKARRIGSRKALREENEHHYIDKSATPDLLDFAMSMLWEDHWVHSSAAKAPGPEKAAQITLAFVAGALSHIRRIAS
ncbi:unnamed protein product, partial [Cladocopium goreaui]